MIQIAMDHCSTLPIIDHFHTKLPAYFNDLPLEVASRMLAIFNDPSKKIAHIEIAMANHFETALNCYIRNSSLLDSIQNENSISKDGPNLSHNKDEQEIKSLIREDLEKKIDTIQEQITQMKQNKGTRKEKTEKMKEIKQIQQWMKQSLNLPDKKKRAASETKRKPVSKGKRSNSVCKKHETKICLDTLEKKEYMEKIINLITVCNNSKTKEKLALDGKETSLTPDLAAVKCNCPLGSNYGYDIGRIFDAWSCCSANDLTAQQKCNIAIGGMNMDDIFHATGEEYLNIIEDE